MFTQKSVQWMIALTLLTILAFGSGLTGVALASGPADEITNATEYIAYLDGLRDLGQAEARVAQARHALNVAVFNHSSYLVSLRDQAATALNHPTVGDATSYISRLEQLRTLGNPTLTDANAFSTRLDQLRQTGQDAVQIGSSQPVLP